MRSRRAWPTAMVWLRTWMPKFAQEQFRQRAGGDARGGFARGSAFQNVASIVKIEFLRAGQISVSGPRRGEAALRVLCAVAVLDRKRFLPIFPVAILDDAARWARQWSCRGARRLKYSPGPFRCPAGRRGHIRAGGGAVRHADKFEIHGNPGGQARRSRRQAPAHEIRPPSQNAAYPVAPHIQN